MTRFIPKRQPARSAPSASRSQRRGGRDGPPSRSIPALPFDSASVERHILAREGQHAVALVPSSRGGYRYLLLRWQPVLGDWWPRASGPLRDPVLASLWALECRHAEPLGWPDHSSFGLHLHALLCGSAYPLDVSELSAAGAAAIPHGLEWEGASK